MKQHIILLLSLFIVTTNYASSRTYKVLWGGDSIGYIKVNRYFSAGKEIIRLKAKSHTSVLWMIQNVSSSGNTTFKNDTLLKSISTLKINKKTETSIASWSGTRYSLISGSSTNIIYKPISFSVSKLYFKEPRNVSQVFSEQHLELCSLTKTSTHTYCLKLPNGDKNFKKFMIKTTMGKAIKLEQKVRK